MRPELFDFALVLNTGIGIGFIGFRPQLVDFGIPLIELRLGLFDVSVLVCHGFGSFQVCMRT